MLSSSEGTVEPVTEKAIISIHPGYGLRATRVGVGDRIEGYVERTPGGKFPLDRPFTFDATAEAVPRGNACRIRGEDI